MQRGNSSFLSLPAVDKVSIETIGNLTSVTQQK